MYIQDLFVLDVLLQYCHNFGLKIGQFLVYMLYNFIVQLMYSSTQAEFSISLFLLPLLLIAHVIMNINYT